MEDADAVDLSKENIQPLKQGRNASILGLALQAQTDEQIHQQLLKVQEAYEIKIRAYSGPDPLELWVEYISWVEQYFPKHGLEGNLEVLLQKCFSALNSEERYKQDQRFVKLWIKFIDMQVDDRLELYRFLSGQGIGTACAEFYRSWAYEFEQMEDYKHADAVYQLGYSNMAQPRAELEAAHTQFQLRVARAVLNNNLNNTEEPVHNPDAENQRSAMASLCPVGPKHNKVGVVRVGPNVLSATPGTLPNPSSSHHARPSLLGPSNGIRDRIQIYQDDCSDTLGLLGKGQASAPTISVHGYRNKENTLKPGKWNKPGAVCPKILPRVAVHQPPLAGPSFEVHRDEVATTAGSTPSVKTFTPNVLKPRKLEEHPIKDTLAIYEQQDPSVKSMYPKHKVYGGGKEFQLEEIMAIEHWKEKSKGSGGMIDPVELERLRLEGMKREIEEKLRLLSVPQPVQPESHRMDEAPQRPLNACSRSEAIGQPNGLRGSTNNSPGSACQSESKESHSTNEESSYGSSARADNRSANSLNVQLTPGDAAFHSANNSNASDLSLDQKKRAFGSGSRGHTSIYNQSVTVHTKLAMHEVDDLWRSPNPAKFPESPAALPARQTLPDPSALAFDICKDETDVIRPPHPSHAHIPTSGLKTTTPSVLSDRGVLSAQPPKNAEPFRILADDPEESLAHALGSDLSYENAFKEPVTVPRRGFLKKGPTVGQKPGVVSDTPYLPNGMIGLSEEGFKAPLHVPLVSESTKLVDTVSCLSKPVNKFPIFGDEPEAQTPVYKELEPHFSVFKEPEAQFSVFKEPEAQFSVFKEPEAQFSVFKEPEAQFSVFKEPEAQFSVFKEPGAQVALFKESKTDEKSDFQFDVFVDEQEGKLPAQAVPPVTPGNKLNVIAKEKENAQKFSHVEIEEIAKKRKVARPRRSILPQFNTAVPTKDDEPSSDLPPQYAEDDDTCTTKVFSGGFLAASTPFTGAISRDKGPKFDFASRELNGSIFLNAPSEEMALPSTVPQKDSQTDEQLSTIYEVSSSINRTSSSQSATSATCAVSSGVADQECFGGIKSSRPHLNPIDKESEDQEIEFHEPYHHDVTVCVNGEVDPFDGLVVHDLLNKLNFPQAHHRNGLLTSTKNMPAKRNGTYVLENENFRVISLLGEGAYAKVWRVVEESTKRHIAMKIQKPSWQWEYYICREIQLRLQNTDMASSFMHAEKVYFYNNGSFLLTELVEFGSLLDLSNKLNHMPQPSKVQKESIVIIMAHHLLRVIEALHSCNIIHGDLKPDNILIRSLPKMNSRDSCLMLIDFGRSIDMSLFPPGTTFQCKVNTDGFSCVEMQSNRPWTYQTDLYGLASSVHCLLLGNYMKVREINGRWQIQHSFPRSADKERWTKFFSSLLNVESCNAMPDLNVVREDLLKGFQFRQRDFDDIEKIIKG